MHEGPNASALRAPDQFLTGCGSRQRRSPTGGWPNGIPLKLRTPSLGAAVDSTAPLAVLTRSTARAGRTAAANITMTGAKERMGIVMVSSILRIPTFQTERPHL